MKAVIIVALALLAGCQPAQHAGVQQQQCYDAQRAVAESPDKIVGRTKENWTFWLAANITAHDWMKQVCRPGQLPK